MTPARGDAHLVTTPSAIYGNASSNPVLSIGNGGAGPTGLIERLALDFLSLHAPGASIEWVCNYSRNTQGCLFAGVIDVALTYEREQEALAEAEGWSWTHGIVFHDHFVIAGPASNPAHLSAEDSVENCLAKVAKAGRAGLATWHARVDGSATMVKERSIWSRLNEAPWTNATDLSTWYRTSMHSPSHALAEADANAAYLVSDRSTFLTLVSKSKVKSTRVYCEPVSADDWLMNSCAALTRPTPSPVALLFVRYLQSERAQKLIGNFGTDKAGLPYFAPSSMGYARASLRGSDH